MSEEPDVMIGLETHVQLNTNTKLFCGCPNEEAENSNSNVCPICLGHPGSKPKLNEGVIRRAIKVSEALQLDIEKDFNFSRKTYFYPDMSKNYQITQYELPVGTDGKLEIKIQDQEKQIGIQRLHIEEDPAKLEHEGGSVDDSEYTLVDYNRAGTPLLEIVTKPDLRSPEEARQYLQSLVKVLEYLGIYSSDSDFTIKSDANISIQGGERVEVKNITGTKGIQQALSYEITRQRQLKKRGREITQQTRSYDSGQDVTVEMREKETEADYGYIFDPDLTWQQITQKYQKQVKEEIPELPREKAERFQQEYGLDSKLVESLVRDKEIADTYEELAQGHDTQLVASWMTGELRKVLNYNDINFENSKITKAKLEYLINLLEDEKITDRNGEKLLREITVKDIKPEDYVEENDLLKAEDDEVQQIIREILDENEEAVQDYREGKDEAINYLVGQVMQKSQGKADPGTARQKIISEIES